MAYNERPTDSPWSKNAKLSIAAFMVIIIIWGLGPEKNDT